MSASGFPTKQRSIAGSSLSARERDAAPQDYTMPTTALTSMIRHFDPCAATAGMFLYAQGNSIVCCQHDTLTIERRFSGHADEVQLLAVDNISENGTGRLVASYDASQNAIVWDIMTGTEVARFASFSNLTAVSWMRNGTVAFGNDSGTIILFEPDTSEHISFRTIHQISVTALAPATDCRTFAIGYQNGSLLICNLQPRFTILHNLSTSRGPSPIVGLAWHASSSRQRSDMLAVQTYDGDLRVWSVAKSHHITDTAKVVRILRRTENFQPGPNWMGWSKNGRIIQFSEGETLSWDVRTKHVTYDKIPTLEHVRGLALYGPGATLFTLGANNTVQQFDLNAPAVKVADVQHPANLLPPSPPVSIEEQDKAAAESAAESATESAAEAGSDYAADASSSEADVSASGATTSESEISIHLDGGVSESDEDNMSPFTRIIHAQAADVDHDSRAASRASSRQSGLSSESGHSSRTPGRYYDSMSNVSRGISENTYMSMGSSLKSSALPQYQQYRSQHQSVAYSITTGSSSALSAGRSSRSGMSRPSRLRNEIPRSPDDARVQDLFKFTRSRLSDVPYRIPPITSDSRLTNDDLRRQMLSSIFGWNKDIKDLVRDEMSQNPPRSPNRILLAKWIGDLEMDIMATGSASMTSSDWMLLALSGIGSQSGQYNLGRAYTQRLLETGDLNAAATIMIGMGDHNDAIEIYVSHHKYMEALIVACLFYPAVWDRQSHLVKKWGEWAIKNGQRELAIRCFACTGKEPTEPWTSPSAAQMNFPSIQAVLPEVLSPPLSPPSLTLGPQRSIARTSTLRLITNFADDKSEKIKFYNGRDEDGATPIAAGVTPIMDSAISPSISSSNGITTAYLRPSQRSAFNTPNSARSTASVFTRQRLPSIGETSADASRTRKALQSAAVELESIEAISKLHSRSISPKAMASDDIQLAASSADNDNYMVGMMLRRAATSSPLNTRKDQPLPSPSPASLAMLMDGRGSRNGPRNRIPHGVDLQIEPGKDSKVEAAPPSEPSTSSTNRYRWPTRRRAPASTSSSITSSSSAAYGNAKSYRLRYGEAVNVGKTLDEYINSLEAAKLRARPSSQERQRQKSLESKRRRRPSTSAGTDTSATPVATPALVEDRYTRGYAGSKSGKRSPRSPVPMSPEDIINLSTAKNFLHDDKIMADSEIAPLMVQKSLTPVSHKSRALSKSLPNSRASSCVRRAKSPECQPQAAEVPRGRNSSRPGFVAFSPTSPLPSKAPHFETEEDLNDYRRAVDEQEKFRNRSTSRPRREPSPGSTQVRDRSRSRRRPTPTVDPPVVVEDIPAPSLAPVPPPRRERSTPGPPPAPSAIAVAAGIGVEREPTPLSMEEPGRKIAPSSMSNSGDLRQLSRDERALRKAAAARELEERRKSLVRRPQAPSVIHPKDLSPSFPQVAIPEMFELDMPDQFVAAKDLPSRSQSVEPEAMHTPSRAAAHPHSMYASRGQSIGLPATPKAMRLVMETGAGGLPSIPPVPANYTYQRSPVVEMGSLEETLNHDAAHGVVREAEQTQAMVEQTPFALLPSTVYQPPRREATPRSMSAPPVELISCSKLERDSMSAMHDFNEISSSRRPSLDERIPPPPPPPRPPMLKELAHLAMPPPPPPAPLHFAATHSQPTYGTGTIEVVMDNGEVHPIITTMSPTQQHSGSMLPPPPPPPPPPPSSAGVESNMTHSHGHQRGRSSTDTSITGRISRATERMRSVSRGQNNISTSSRTKSPDNAFAPYESIQIPSRQSDSVYVQYESVPPPPAYIIRTSPPQAQNHRYTTGLHQDEMF